MTRLALSLKRSTVRDFYHLLILLREFVWAGERASSDLGAKAIVVACALTCQIYMAILQFQALSHLRPYPSKKRPKCVEENAYGSCLISAPVWHTMSRTQLRTRVWTRCVFGIRSSWI
ncbi:unnamed protein product [Arctia plantaginis]|uniref:Uncharacterized protein n=1 Tax=Arctia plantaginis TaxID=874455 RepID=A0A8S0Z0H0_ARCPL|nr:unnamed protein product [Arctia plantaginis]